MQTAYTTADETSTFEIRVSRVRETPGESVKIDRAGVALEYWRKTIEASSWHDAD